MPNFYEFRQEESVLRERFGTLNLDNYGELRALFEALKAWRRYDVLDEVLDAALAVHQAAQDVKASLEQWAQPETLNTIGGRKGNKINKGQYTDAPSPVGLRPSIYLPSAKSFLRGDLGHVYTGIIALTGAFRYQDPSSPTGSSGRDREMIFLAPNGPPTVEQQAQASISEAYMGRNFTQEVLGSDVGFNSWNDSTKVMAKSDYAIVHGVTGGGHTSHEQLRELIVKSNRYKRGACGSGYIIDDDDPTPGEGKMIGFTVMKGGFRPGTQTKLANVYGWTSNSMNKSVWTQPTHDYRSRQTMGVDPSQQGRVLARIKAQVEESWAAKIEFALDNILDLQLEDAIANASELDPYFVRKIGQLEM